MSPKLPPFLEKIKSPLDWNKAHSHELAKIRGVCLDIDDTLSTSGKLTAQAFSALWELKKSGFVVVPITGRPAGWCDHIARFWPVDAVVGENGAFSFFMRKGIRERINTPVGMELPSLRDKLEKLKIKLIKHFPTLQWASDQPYREYDLAIDICEDVEPWLPEKTQALLDLCNQEKAHAKLSSVHINAWFGDYDKKRGFDYWLSQGAPGCVQKPPTHEEWLYIGDSPNDEPMFAGFQYSLGVANLKKYLPGMGHWPTWLTEGNSGEGFSQMVAKLIQSCEMSSSL